MPERDRRSSRRRNRLPNPSSPLRRRHASSSKSTASLNRCSSEPAMKIPSLTDGCDRSLRRRRRFSPGSESENMIRLQNCTEIFASSPSLLPSITSHENLKVVVTVTVEGSPGEIRSMVKLSSTVEDAIHEIVTKFNQEKRTPKLLQSQGLELHNSYFSLQCLDKSEIIGDIGSRSFYLRKSNKDSSSDLLCSQIVPCFSSPSYFARAVQKFLRRTRKLWKILICSQ